MSALILALMAATGSYWCYTALVFGWRGLGPRAGPHDSLRSVRNFDVLLMSAGLEGVSVREFCAVVVTLFGLGTVLTFMIFGGLLPAAVVGCLSAIFPVFGYRVRRRNRRERAAEAWPALIAEIRVQTGSLGRSIPQALFDVGRRGPLELRPAFEAAHREWLLTRDLARSLAVLKNLLGDSTADMTCETLLIAHELGGNDLDRRLAALVEDRRCDVQSRRDGRARQSGARFARLFVLLVPAGMALAGMSIGNGRRAYQTPTGQVVVLIAICLVVLCWVWAGRVMRLPEPERVFDL